MIPRSRPEADSVDDVPPSPAARHRSALLRVGAIVAAALAVALIPVLAACGGPADASTVSGSPSASASSATPTALPTAAGKSDADAALAAFNKAFLTQSDGKAYYRLSTTGGTVTFFKQAELIEMTQDAWARSHDPAYKTMMGMLYRGLLAHSSSMPAWLSKTNDDLMWASIMCLRAYRITGDRRYLLRAQKVFDATYARAYSSDLGGGLWNSVHNRTKNACIVLPASVAASMLYRSLHQASYRRKATQLYAWLRRTLYDTKTGAVYDHVTPQSGGGMTVDRTTWTYNQGIMIEAADLLYRITGKSMYYNDALRTLAFTKSDLTVDGILKSEVPSGSALDVSPGGYKGIFVRWATMFIKRHHLAAYNDWLRQNAAAVKQVADARGLMDEDWTVQTGDGPLSAFSCSSAVVLLQWAPVATQ